MKIVIVLAQVSYLNIKNMMKSHIYLCLPSSHLDKRIYDRNSNSDPDPDHLCIC